MENLDLTIKHLIDGSELDVTLLKHITGKEIIDTLISINFIPGMRNGHKNYALNIKSGDAGVLSRDKIIVNI